MAKPLLRKALLLCLLAAALIASANVVSKEVMDSLPFLMVGFCWYFLPWIWFTLCALWQKQRPFRWLLQHWKVGALLGSTNYLAGLAWIYAIYQIGPATTGFFQRIETVVFFLLGVFFLRERITLVL